MSPKKKKSRKAKSVIIEPLYKDQNATSFNKPITSIVEQPEFNRIFFSLLDLSMKLIQEIQRSNPGMTIVDLEGLSEENTRILAQAIDAVGEQILKEDDTILIDIVDKLHHLRKRLIKSGQRQLIKEVEFYIEFFSSDQDVREIAHSNLIREIILKHFFIFAEFSETLEAKLGYSLDEVLLEEKGDDENLEAVVNEFEERYPGFIAKTFDVEESELESEISQEDILEIFNSGMQSIVNEEIVLNLFTQKEIKKGAEIAKTFYEALTPKEKQMVQSGSGNFAKSEAFMQEIERFLDTILTPKRMDKILQKIEKIMKKPKYQLLTVFFDSLLFYLVELDRKNAINKILIYIFSAEVRRAFKKSTDLPTLLFWYL
ncbi:hypothetical protein DRI50_00865 [candidate division KSB1 bacterium]|nr:MAG: hypothetical protein DRI50_00865 [candidate division KSB1 bacterium]